MEGEQNPKLTLRPKTQVFGGVRAGNRAEIFRSPKNTSRASFKYTGCFALTSLPFVPVIGQFMRLTCIMFSIPKKSKGVRYTILKFSISPKPAAHFENL